MLITAFAEEIANLVKNMPGTVFAYPTETFYGLGCPVADNRAIMRIISAKGRDAAKGMIVLASGMHQARSLAEIDSRQESLLGHFWPGALSAVLKCHQGPHEQALFTQNGMVAVRVSSNPLAAELVRILGPVISTSANPSGMGPADCAEAVVSYGLDIDAILDGGRTPGGLPSTLINLSGRAPVCLRQGSIPFENILEYWKGLE
jgi:L-threonylcarbamoyladenylate synthase